MLSLVAICPYANLLPISIIVCKLVHCVLMKSQFKQSWSTISTKRTICQSPLILANGTQERTTPYGVGNPADGLGKHKDM